VQVQTFKNQIKPQSLLALLSSLPVLVAAFFGTKSEGDLKNYLIFVLVSLVVILLANYFWLRRNERRAVFLLLPALFSLGAFGILATVSGLGFKVIIALALALLFYFYQLRYPVSHSTSLEEVFNLVTALVLLVFLWALSFFFNLSWWGLLMITFILFFLLFWQAFYKIGKQSTELSLWTLLSAILVVEVSWAVLYLPVHFLTSSVVVFSAFYLIYMFSRLYQKDKLSRDKIYFQLGLMGIVLLLSLVSSRWTP